MKRSGFCQAEMMFAARDADRPSRNEHQGSHSGALGTRRAAISLRYAATVSRSTLSG
jgi:hypothetical protein